MQVNDKTLKFMIFILTFLVVVTAFVLFFVIPGIKAFKTKKAEYYQQLRTEKRLAEEEKTLEAKLQQLKEKNAKVLHAFQKDFDEAEFLKMAHRYFKNVKLLPKRKRITESGLQTYEFEADFNADTPVQFYRFIDTINRMDNIVKINFPIILEAHNRIITIQFNMSVYRLLD